MINDRTSFKFINGRGLKVILEKIDENFEKFNDRITELENLNNMEHAFSSSTEDFALF